MRNSPNARLRHLRPDCGVAGVRVSALVLLVGMFAPPAFAQNASASAAPAQPAATQLPASPSTSAAAPAAAPTVSAAAASAPSVPSATPAAAPLGGPIAIVPLVDTKSGGGATVTGALQVTDGKAIIAASGTVTSGSRTTNVILPRRGTLRVCASTSVKLAADSSVPKGEVPGLMMALSQGAVEASLATGRNADILLTPDFRILISGPGAADVKVRLGRNGDTCVDNAGIRAPYVLVTSVFDGSNYRVMPGQRVMFQHGSTQEVVDNEKEPCGCPPPPQPGTNEFPLAQSAGLAPLAAPAKVKHSGPTPQVIAPLVYRSRIPAIAVVKRPVTPVATPTTAPAKSEPIVKKKAKRRGFFRRIGHFFKRLFGG